MLHLARKKQQSTCAGPEFCSCGWRCAVLVAFWCWKGETINCGTAMLGIARSSNPLKLKSAQALLLTLSHIAHHWSSGIAKLKTINVKLQQCGGSGQCWLKAFGVGVGVGWLEYIYKSISLLQLPIMFLGMYCFVL